MLSQFFKRNKHAPVFVHSDLMPILSGMNIDLRTFAINTDYQQRTLNSILNDLRRFVGERDIWFPAFNYDFCQNGIFDLKKSVSQVGSFAEYFRVNHAEWRTKTPIFSFTGEGSFPCLNAQGKFIDPFDFTSDFGRLQAENGVILFYGSDFSPTFIHFIERVFQDGPSYRYDKLFSGKVISDKTEELVTVKYHVKPSSLCVRYDVKKVASDLSNAGLLKSVSDRFQPCQAVEAKSMLDFCLEKLNQDSLYFLTEPSKSEVSKMLNKMGRRFLQSDFESQSLGEML